MCYGLIRCFLILIDIIIELCRKEKQAEKEISRLKKQLGMVNQGSDWGCTKNAAMYKEVAELRTAVCSLYSVCKGTLCALILVIRLLVVVVYGRMFRRSSGFEVCLLL